MSGGQAVNAKVRIIRSNSSYDIEYTYIVPESIARDVHVGVFVDVPFGIGNRTCLGIVVGIDPSGEDSVVAGGKTRALKPVVCVNKGYRPLDGLQMELCDMMARRYVCGTAETYGLMTARIAQEKEELVKILKLAVSADEADAYIRGRRSVKEGAFAAIRMLSENPGGMPEKTVMTVCEISASVIKRLADDGIVQRDKAPASSFEDLLPDKKSAADADAAEDAAKPKTERKNVVLNKGQEDALEKLSERLFSGKFSEFLLRGVTGSGKTEVYFRLIKQVLDQGFGAILLVPEIVLTEQMIKRVRSFFGDAVAVLHSRITDRKKAQEYARIDSGEVRLVLGVRSAVFAPVKDLKLIILDEEQEPSFKSFDSRPYYHAGEVAAMRMKQNRGLLVYGSATPRITTYYRALSGEIGYACLKERAFSQSLPDVIIVDMKQEGAAPDDSPISIRLARELKENIDRGEQSIIFLPRRGYSSKLICGGCGRMIVCKNCGISMTYHKNYERLVCHYCGTSKPSPDVCPACGSKNIKGRTFGTEFAEDELRRLFPGVQIVRMDSDTTRAVDGHRKLLDRFEYDKVPILVGTQMVAKGLDFPNVTLVGIVNADSLMAVSEYNAAERAFQLLTQVTGRAGRDPEKPGRCVLQTMNPGSSVIRTASTQDYDKFVSGEIEFRKMLEFPPFSSFATVTVSGADDRAVRENALIIREAVLKIASDEHGVRENGGLSVLQVTRSPVAKVDDNFFWCFTVKSQDKELLINAMNVLKNTVTVNAYKKGTAVKGGPPVKNYKISIDADLG